MLTETESEKYQDLQASIQNPIHASEVNVYKRQMDMRLQTGANRYRTVRQLVNRDQTKGLEAVG